MPNNFARWRVGYNPNLTGLRRMKRKDVVTAINVQNRAFAAAATNLGPVNGGPASTTTGSPSGGGSGSIGTALR